jgi:uncharacterized membrane protein
MDVGNLPAQLTARAQVDWPDVVLAVAAGTVGALAFTTGIHTPLVGVMVAVALLPPLVATGLLAGTGLWVQSMKAALLYSTNLVCIMLGAVATFMLQGVHPRTWWEADEAKRSSRRALGMLTVLALVLVTLILVAREADREVPTPPANRAVQDAAAQAPGSPASEESR